MIRALAWKEYREHRAVWLTLAIVGIAGLYGLARLLEPGSTLGAQNSPSEPLISVAALLAWTYGLVCGAMLLAGERESATMTFLDMLPVSRLQLWFMKCTVGLVLSLGQVAVLTGCLIALGGTEHGGQMAVAVLAMLGVGVFGLCWGLLFSARGESVLNAIGLAMAAQFAISCAIGLVSVPLLATLAFIWPNTPLLPGILGWLMLIALFVGPLVGSARLFSRTDRLRRRGMQPAGRRRDVNLAASWVRLLWLNYMQMRRLIIGLTIFALALGFLVPVVGPVGWPILTLFFGVLCGVTVCADEQAHGSFRFLGDQRLPLGRVWLIKFGMRFALAVLAAFLLLLPSLVLTIFHAMEAHSRGEHRVPFFADVLHSCLVVSVVPADVHLTMWLLYGFTVGQLGGLLFRKSIVAAFVSLGVSALLVSLWLPSLLGIGLHFWQIACVPAILLALGWTLVPAWAADRLLARETFARLGVGFVTAGLCIVAGLWYRVAEVPNVPDQLDMPAFVAGLPSLEENKAGQLIRSACAKVDSRDRALSQNRPQVPNQMTEPLSAQAARVIERGWLDKKPELAAWLDAMFKDNWVADLAEVPDLPLGVVEDPRRLTIGSTVPMLNAARLLPVILAARGLQQQAAGHDEIFADNLSIGLAIARTLQHDAILISALIGRLTESVWLSGLDRWLEKLRGHPQLLKRVLQTLLRHEAELPDERQALQAEYLMALNTLEETPEQLMKTGMENRVNEDARLREAEFQGAALAWLFPLEQERHRRILRVMFQGDAHQRRNAREWGGVLSEFGSRSNHLARPKRGLVRLRASQLQVALRLYQAETGKPAASLDLLVPRYLPVVPADPFDGQPFRYRLSKGERIGWPAPDAIDAGPNAVNGEPELAAPAGEMAEAVPGGGMAGMGGAMPPAPAPTRFVPKGQGILWSVGEDGRDDGGVQQSTPPFGSHFGEDIIYLVPPPAK